VAKRIGISIEVNENGTIVAKRVGDGFTEAAKKIERNTRDSFSKMNVGVGQALDDMTTKMVRWGALAGGIFGGLVLRSVARLGTEFQTRMSAVGAFAEATGAEFDQLRKQALALGEATVFTATNAAEAMEQLGLAGFKTTEILKVMPDVLNLAAAGTLSMADAAQISTNVIRQMGLSASEFTHASDTLAFSAAESTTTVQELGTAFSYVGNVARTMGLKVEDVASALAILANQGVAGERAGTGLVRILSVMLGKTEEGEKGLGKFNLRLFDQEGRFVGLAEAMRRMQAAGMSTQDVMEGFGQRGGPTMLALLNAGAKSLDEFTERTKDAGGFAAKMGKALRDNLGGDVEQLTGAFQTLAIEVFQKVTPALRDFAKSGADLARTWNVMLQGSDVVGGLSRAFNLLKVALAGLTINAARTAFAALVGGLSAVSTSAIVAATGVSAMDAALLTSIPIMEAVALAGKAMWVAIGGIALAVFELSRQATRAILEITGLDSAIQSFFAMVLNRGGDAPAVLQQFQEGLVLIDKTLLAIGAKGIDFNLDAGALDEVRKNVTQLQQVVANGVRMHFSDKDVAPLTAALETATRQSREVLSLSREFGPRFNVAWKQAADGAKTLEDRIAKVKALLQGGAAAPESKSGGGGGPDPETVKAIAAATKQLEKSLLAVGFVSKQSIAGIEKDFGRIGAVAEAQKVPIDELARAFREDLIAIGNAAGTSGQQLSAFMNDLVNRAGSLPPIKLTFESDAISEEEWTDQIKRSNENRIKLNADTTMQMLEFNRQATVEGTTERLAAENAIELAEFDMRLDAALTREGLLQDERTRLATAGADARAALEQRQAEAATRFSNMSTQAQIANWSMVAVQGAEVMKSIFHHSKAAAYAAAIVNTAAGVTHAFYDPGGWAGLALGIIVGLAGAVQISKIKSTNYAAEGAVITRGPAHMIAGERGAEAIVPLTGAPARRVAKAMGVGQGGHGVQVTQHFHGDNWRDGGIANDLAEMIYDSVQSLIRRGRKPAWAYGTA